MARSWFANAAYIFACPHPCQAALLLVDEQGLGEVYIVVGIRQCSSCVVGVGLHTRNAVVCLLLGQVLHGERNGEPIKHCTPAITGTSSSETKNAEICRYASKQIRTYGIELGRGDIRFFRGGEGSEGGLHLLGWLHVLSLSTDHECHVFLQRNKAIPANIHTKVVS